MMIFYLDILDILSNIIWWEHIIPGFYLDIWWYFWMHHLENHYWTPSHWRLNNIRCERVSKSVHPLRNDNTIDVHKKQHLQSLDWVYSSVSNSRFVPTINLCLWVCSNLNRNLPEPDELKANVANGNCGESQTLNKSLKICPGKSCPLGLLQTVSVKSQKRHCLMDLQDNDRTYRVTLPRAQSTQ